ncbi:MAG: RNA polymerase sigma factor [Planctomycetota bacterium]
MGVGELYSAYGAKLLRAALRVTGSAADAEEAVAEAFLALVRNPGLLEEGRDPWPYLHRAVVNRALNQLRRRRRAPEPLPASLAAAPGRDRELAERLRAGVARLTPRQAEVFTLFHFEGVPHDEIARLLDIRPSTVRVHLHDATQALRRDFESREARHA